jgi:hypothetical protein
VGKSIPSFAGMTFIILITHAFPERPACLEAP